MNSVKDSDLLEIDQWALLQLNSLVKVCRDAFESFDFHVAYHAIHNFCTIDMSNFYLDVIKDRLYVEAADSVSRRAAQTTIYKILVDLTLILAPLLAYTSNEIWREIPKSKKYNPDYAVLNDIPEVKEMDLSSLASKWDRIHSIRDDVNKALELARNDKLIGKSLEASVELHCKGELFSFIKSVEQDLPMVFITSEVTVIEDESGSFIGNVSGLSVTVKHAEGEKCERCWTYTKDVGSDPNHPTLCARCAKIVR